MKIRIILISFSLFLVTGVSFAQKNKAPKSREWIATWGLLVTLIWLYIEVLRLMRRLAVKW